MTIFTFRNQSSSSGVSQGHVVCFFGPSDSWSHIERAVDASRPTRLFRFFTNSRLLLPRPITSMSSFPSGPPRWIMHHHNMCAHQLPPSTFHATHRSLVLLNHTAYTSHSLSALRVQRRNRDLQCHALTHCSFGAGPSGQRATFHTLWMWVQQHWWKLAKTTIFTSWSALISRISL